MSEKCWKLFECKRHNRQRFVEVTDPGIDADKVRVWCLSGRYQYPGQSHEMELVADVVEKSRLDGACALLETVQGRANAAEDWITRINGMLGNYRNHATFIDDAVAGVVSRMEQAEKRVVLVEAWAKELEQHLQKVRHQTNTEYKYITEKEILAGFYRSVRDIAAALSNEGSEPIRVWRFRDAPEPLQKLSRHGGDEDWLAMLPPNTEEPVWAGEGTSFGCCSVSRHDLAGFVVLIGAHS